MAKDVECVFKQKAKSTIAPLKGEVNGLYMRACISMSGGYRVCTVFILKNSSILLNRNKASPNSS
jgi:hypothetical protein